MRVELHFYHTILQLYTGDQFQWWNNKTRLTKENLRQITNKLYHITLYRVHLSMVGNRTNMYWWYDDWEPI